MTSMSDTDCSETPDLSNEPLNVSNNTHANSNSDSSPVHANNATIINNTSTTTTNNNNIKVANTNTSTSYPNSPIRAYNTNNLNDKRLNNIKRKNEEDIPLSFASFYYSLKVLKAKGT